MSGLATHQAAVMGAIASRTLTLDELAAALPIERRKIVKATGKLITREFLERAETGVYRLTLTGRQALEAGKPLTSGPHRGTRKIALHLDTLQQRAWKAMRLTKRFSIPDIVVLAARETEPRAAQSLQRFFLRLTKAGYLAELEQRRPGDAATSPGHKLWRLVRDTGDHAPRWLDRQQAFRDWNTREVFPCR